MSVLGGFCWFLMGFGTWSLWSMVGPKLACSLGRTCKDCDPEKPWTQFDQWQGHPIDSNVYRAPWGWVGFAITWGVWCSSCSSRGAWGFLSTLARIAIFMDFFSYIYSSERVLCIPGPTRLEALGELSTRT